MKIIALTNKYFVLENRGWLKIVEDDKDTSTLELTDKNIGKIKELIDDLLDG